jgi:hypothetical protein
MMITVLTPMSGRISLYMMLSYCYMLMLHLVHALPLTVWTLMHLPVVTLSLIVTTTVILQVLSLIVLTLITAVRFQLKVTMSTVTTSLYRLGDPTVVTVYAIQLQKKQRRKEEEKKG